jgi:hypothetical protein
MELVYFKVEIKFAEQNQLYTPAHRVFSALGGKDTAPKPSEPGTQMRIKDLRGLINWDYAGCKISIEEIESRDACIDVIMKLLEIINSAVPITKISSRELVTNWIIPARKQTFSALEKLYRQRMMTERKFMQGTYDSSVVLDIKIDDYILHHQSGPMEPKQLHTYYLEYERKDLPKVFLFLYTSLSDTKMVEYSREEMQHYLEKAFDQCKAHSQVFNETWEGYL